MRSKRQKSLAGGEFGDGRESVRLQAHQNDQP